MSAAATWLEHCALGIAMRDSAYLYPTVNLLHLLGLMLLGGIGMLDLRYLGFGRAVNLDVASRHLTQIGIAGLLVALPSGFLLFVVDAVPLLDNWVFQVKLCLILLAISNAFIFRRLWSHRLAAWDDAPPLLGRVQAAASLLMWLGAAAAGRLIAYS